MSFLKKFSEQASKVGLNAISSIFANSDHVYNKVREYLENHPEYTIDLEKLTKSIFKYDPCLDHAFQSKEEVIGFVRENFITGLIEPLQEQIQEIRTKKSDKEKELHTAEARRNELADKKAVLARQMQSIAEMRQSI